MARDNRQRIGFVDPISIVLDRYGGLYSERGPWTAFPCESRDVPREPSEDDGTARAWWERIKVPIVRKGPLPIGGGSTPDEACLDLIERLVAIEPDRVHGPNPGDGKYMWTWLIRWPDGRGNVVDSILEESDWSPPTSS